VDAQVGQQEAHAVTLVAGDIFAELILLLDEPYPTTGRTLTDVVLYKLEDQFWEVLQMCPTLMRKILKISAERSQIHESVTTVAHLPGYNVGGVVRVK